VGASSGLRVFSGGDATLDALRGKCVAVLGYGAQGHAHALNLRDSNVDIIVAQRTGSARHAAAVADGFLPVTLGEAVATADLLIFALPDEAIPSIFAAEVAPRLRPGQTLGFLHGFAVHFGGIKAPAGVDVVLLAPKAQGRAVRREFMMGRGVAALVAVAQDASGSALKTALAWGAGIGAARAAIFETTFKDETETDLFGEQVVLCGGLTALIQGAFDTLVDAGYPPELAYFECCHEVKLLADLIQAGGITHMRERVSNAARFGDLTRGPRVIGPDVRAEMGRILDEIRTGRFAAELAAEREAGYTRFRALTEAGRRHGLETTGERVRALMAGNPAAPS